MTQLQILDRKRSSSPADIYELSNGRNATSDTNCVRNPSIHSLTYIIATLAGYQLRPKSFDTHSLTYIGRVVSLEFLYEFRKGGSPPQQRLSVVLKWVP